MSQEIFKNEKLLKRRSNRFKDIKGLISGRLCVKRLVGISHNRKALWECFCACGKRVIVSGDKLRRKTTKSCGCLRLEKTIARSFRHGCSPRGLETREYKAWCGAKGRCFNEADPYFKDYGGRGIVMCKSWANSFIQFLNDMGSCPQGYSIDRINNEGNYEPGNCRWADRFTQANNTRINRFIKFKGRIQTFAQWERELGLPRGHISRTLRKGRSGKFAIDPSFGELCDEHKVQTDNQAQPDERHDHTQLPF